MAKYFFKGDRKIYIDGIAIHVGSIVEFEKVPFGKENNFRLIREEDGIGKDEEIGLAKKTPLPSGVKKSTRGKI